MTKVTVIDTIMGAGKTSYMIEVMNSDQGSQFTGFEWIQALKDIHGWQGALDRQLDDRATLALPEI